MFTDNSGNLLVQAFVSDTMTFEGTAGNDTFTVVNWAVHNATVSDGLKTVIASGAKMVVLKGDGGSDTFDVSGTEGPNLTILGDVSSNDTLNLSNTAAGTTTFEAGNTWDSGTITTPDGLTTAFTGMQTVTLIGNGTAADNTFTADTYGMITLAAYNGTTDELNSNAQPILYFTNYGAVNLDDTGLGNGDVFDITPVGLDGAGVTNVNVTGNATARAVVNDSGGDAVTVNNSGTPQTVQVGATAPLIEIESATPLTINGDGTGDALTVYGSIFNDLFTLTPGVTSDSGTLMDNSLPPLTFQNLGTSQSGTPGSLTIDGNGAVNADFLTYEGTSSSDTFNVAATTGTITLYNQNPFYGQIDVFTSRIQFLTLNGNGGNDQFTVSAPTPYNGIWLNGGASYSIATLNGDASSDAVVSNFGARAPSPASPAPTWAPWPWTASTSCRSPTARVISTWTGPTRPPTPSSSTPVPTPPPSPTTTAA